MGNQAIATERVRENIRRHKYSHKPGASWSYEGVISRYVPAKNKSVQFSKNSKSLQVIEDFIQGVKDKYGEGKLSPGSKDFTSKADKVLANSEQVELIKKLYKQGKTYPEIAEKIIISSKGAGVGLGKPISRIIAGEVIDRLIEKGDLQERDYRTLRTSETGSTTLRRNKIREFLTDEIDKFKKGTVLPGEKYTSNFNELTKKFGVSRDTLSKDLDTMTDLDFVRYGADAAPTQLSREAQEYFKKHYKTQTLAQMSKRLTGKPYENTENANIRAQLERFRDTYIKRGFVKKEDLHKGIGKTGAKLGYKVPNIKEAMKKRAERQIRLAKAKPEIIDNPEFIRTQGKLAGKFSPQKMDKKLLQFLQMDTVGGSLHPRFPKFLKPSYEHIQGLAAADIIGDSDALRKVTIASRRFNWQETGSTSNIYREVKDWLNTSQTALNQGERELADDALKITNKLYDELANRFPNLERKDLPFYEVVGNGRTIRETNLEGLIKPQTLEKAFGDYFKSVADTHTDSEINFIRKIQPNAAKVIELFKDNKIVDGMKLIKNRIPQVLPKRMGGRGALFSWAALAALGGLGTFGTSPLEAAETQSVVKQPVVEPQETLKYNSTLGSIVNTKTEEPADQSQVWEWIKENPVKTVAGTSIGFSTQEIPGAYKKARELGRGRTRSALGITGALKPVLTTFGTPAMTALFEVPFSAKRLEEGETMTEVLTDPFGPALGLSLMETLSQKAGVVRDAPKRTMAEGLRNYFNLSNVGTARPGVTSKILRMGMSPRMIAGASRFLGLPGLALSLGLTGYDAYKNYQNQEGMLYNFFNKDE